MNTKLRKRYWAVGMAAVVTLTTTGCGGYGDLSPTAYKYATALYSIANRRASTALSSVEHQIESSGRNEEISKQEAQWLREIVLLAQDGDWDAAAREARQMMEDQVDRS